MAKNERRKNTSKPEKKTTGNIRLAPNPVSGTKDGGIPKRYTVRMETVTDKIKDKEQKIKKEVDKEKKKAEKAKKINLMNSQLNKENNRHYSSGLIDKVENTYNTTKHITQDVAQITEATGSGNDIGSASVNTADTTVAVGVSAALRLHDKAKEKAVEHKRDEIEKKSEQLHEQLKKSEQTKQLKQEQEEARQKKYVQNSKKTDNRQENLYTTTKTPDNNVYNHGYLNPHYYDAFTRTDDLNPNIYAGKYDIDRDNIRDDFEKSQADIQNVYEKKVEIADLKRESYKEDRKEEKYEELRRKTVEDNRSENVETFQKGEKQKRQFDDKREKEEAKAKLEKERNKEYNKQITNTNEDTAAAVGLAALVQQEKEITTAEDLHSVDKEARELVKSVYESYQNYNTDIDTGDNLGGSLNNLATRPITAMEKAGLNKVKHGTKELAKKGVRKAGQQTQRAFEKAAERSQKKLSEVRAERARKAAYTKRMHDQKVAYYKAEQGAKAAAAATQVVKEKLIELGTKAATAVASSSSAGVIIAVILAIILIPLIIIMLFSWMDPHKETVFDVEAKEYKDVYLGEEKQTLEGYIALIKDIFDEEQLHILETVDKDFGGFDPDDYKYDHESEDEKNENIAYIVNIGIQGKYTDTLRQNSGTLLPQYNKTTESIQPMVLPFKVIYYYKIDPVTGGYMQCSKEEAVKEKAVWAQLGGLKGKLSQQFFDTNIPTEEDKKFIINYYLTNNSLYAKYYNYPDHITSKTIDITESTPNGTIKIGSYTQTRVTATPTFEINESEQKSTEILDHGNDIWDLYQYENKWIKLNEEMDCETIIALAAIRKFQKLENGDTQADNSEQTEGISEKQDNNEKISNESEEIDISDIFYLTDEDLRSVIKASYEFWFEYHYVAECPKADCDRMFVGFDPGHWEYFHSDDEDHTGHTVLVGSVLNWTDYGEDFYMKKIIDFKVPTYEDDLEIYKAYKEYISEQLGSVNEETGEFIPSHNPIDYSNEEEMPRLIAKYEATTGQKWAAWRDELKKTTEEDLNLRDTQITIRH